MKSSRIGFVIATVAMLLFLVNTVSAQNNQWMNCYKDCVKKCGNRPNCDAVCSWRCGDKSARAAAVIGSGIGETYDGKVRDDKFAVKD